MIIDIIVGVIFRGKPEIKAEGNPENLQDREVKEQSKKKSMDQRGNQK